MYTLVGGDICQEFLKGIWNHLRQELIICLPALIRDSSLFMKQKIIEIPIVRSYFCIFKN